MSKRHVNAIRSSLLLTGFRPLPCLPAKSLAAPPSPPPAFPIPFPILTRVRSQAGLHHVDLYFPDGCSPSLGVAAHFIELIERAPGTAVCLAPRLMADFFHTGLQIFFCRFFCPSCRYLCVLYLSPFTFFRVACPPTRPSRLTSPVSFLCSICLVLLSLPAPAPLCPARPAPRPPLRPTLRVPRPAPL